MSTWFTSLPPDQGALALVFMFLLVALLAPFVHCWHLVHPGIRVVGGPQLSSTREVAQSDMQRFRTIADHDPADPEPLMLRAGQRVRYERRESEWEGWLWCTSESGETGWVPEAWLTLRGPFAVAQRDYCARELTVRRGTVVSGSLIECGWLWATTDAGVSGWVPLRVLEQSAGECAT